MQVIKGAHQLNLVRQQHAVTEHIAGHVAYSHHAKQVALGIHIEVFEVAFNRLPGTAGGDAHFFVVVAVGTARGEGIAQPVAILDGNFVGDIREGRRAFIGSHDQIGIIFIVANNVFRRHHIATHQIVSNIQQRADKNLIAGDALFLHHIAAGVFRHALAHETAFGADRYDNRVLHLLGFH